MTSPEKSSLSQEVIELLRCPDCHGTKSLHRSHVADSGRWKCRTCGRVYRETAGVPLFLRDAGEVSHEKHEVDTKRLRSTSDAAQAVYWNADLGHRDPEHPVVAGFATQRWSFLEKLFEVAHLGSALDVGCGSGFSTLYAPSHLVRVGCDRSVAMLVRNPTTNRLCASALELPFADGSFDLVYCWEVLHHVDEPHRVLREMARVSRRYVLVIEPNPWNLAQFLFALYDPEHHWVLRYRKPYLIEQFRKAHLTVAKFVRGGLIFPNRTPRWLFEIARHLPYRIPLIGISQLALGTKEPQQNGSHPQGVDSTRTSA